MPGSMRPTEVRCPICLDVFDWEYDDLFRYQNGTYVPLNVDNVGDELKRRDEMIGAYRRCPNPSADMPERHYLPVDYASYGPPLVVGLIGRTESGKSHLLASMINEIEQGGLGQLGLTSIPVDADQHQEFIRNRVAPLVEQSVVIPHTAPVPDEAQVNFADALLVGATGQQRAVAFFDVAGDDLERRTRSMRFVLALDALIFVVDPEYIRDHARSSEGDTAFKTVMDRLRAQPDIVERIPAAIVIAKSDLYRFEQPVASWYRRPTLSAYPDGIPNADEIRDESRDAYAFLYAKGATAWLRPFEMFRRTTLHFASATGSAAVDVDRGSGRAAKVFPRGVRPRRVLDPLAAVLAMVGMLGEDAAKEVGS
jgi:hypothetical protein